MWHSSLITANTSEVQFHTGQEPNCTALLLLQGVGKSCLVLRYVRGQFDPSSKVTVGAAFMSHSVHLPDGTTVKFEIWYNSFCMGPPCSARLP